MTQNLDDRTLHPVDLSKRARRAAEAAGAPEYWGQARCPIYRSVTFNMKRSALNFQRGDRKGGWWAEYGDRHGIWTTGLLTRWTCPRAGRTVEAGSAPRYGDGHDVRYANQERPTCNVQLSTFNGVTERADAGRDMGTDTMSDIPIRNVQRETFNSQLLKGVTERADGARDMGTDTEVGQPDSWPSGPDPAPVGRSKLAGHQDMGTDTMSDIPIRNAQRGTFNSQLLTA